VLPVSPVHSDGSVVLALYLALRRAELLGLRWEDVDLDGEKLEVVQTLQRVRGALHLVPPKTDDSARTVPLPLPCLEALREQLRLAIITWIERPTTAGAGNAAWAA
jgi:integrase